MWPIIFLGVCCVTLDFISVLNDCLNFPVEEWYPIVVGTQWIWFARHSQCVVSAKSWGYVGEAPFQTYHSWLNQQSVERVARHLSSFQ